jgi:4-carboxymuconolactone decarboxylase
MTGQFDRYRNGIETLLALSPDKSDLISNALAAEAPEFARLMIEFVFADILAREGLDRRARLFVAIGAQAACGNAPAQLRWFVRSALTAGASREEAIEALMQVSVHAGFAAASNALEACRDLLVDQSAADDRACPLASAAR